MAPLPESSFSWLFSRVLIFRLAFLALYVVTGGISTEAVKGLQSSGFLFSGILSRKSITFSKLQAMRLMLDKTGTAEEGGPGPWPPQ